ncbi:MAG: hypothetical protein K2W33_16820, partial [Burkholderiales bacterium]|nr:hypothetical protein [Burkholderiales bacterium]
MKPVTAIAIGAFALAAAVGAGYQLGQAGKTTHGQAATSTPTSATAASTEAPHKQPKLLYYRNPM